MVGPAVYDVLRHREKYISKFRSYRAKDKHGVDFEFYQFVDQLPGLNIDAPPAFVAKRTQPTKLSRLVAHYFALAVNNRRFLELRKGDPGRDYAGVVLLTYLARDAVRASNTAPFDEPYTTTWGDSDASFEERYRHYLDLDWTPVTDLAESLVEKHLQNYEQYFEKSAYGPSYLFVNEAGVAKLKAEWPDVANQHGLLATNSPPADPNGVTTTGS